MDSSTDTTGGAGRFTATAYNAAGGIVGTQAFASRAAAVRDVKRQMKRVSESVFQCTVTTRHIAVRDGDGRTVASFNWEPCETVEEFFAALATVESAA
jgi:hypothetical protein